MSSLEHFGYRQELQRALTFRDLLVGAVWLALGLVYFAVQTIILKKPAAIDL
jgi:hypothetical protein